MILFPGMILPLNIGRESSIAAAQQAVRSERPIGLLLQKDPSNDNPGPDDVHRAGTVAQVLRYVTTPDGGHHLICQGQERFVVREFLPGYPFLVARVERITDGAQASQDIEARFMQLKKRAAEALELLPQTPQELVAALQNFTSPGGLADMVAGFMDIKPAEKQRDPRDVQRARRAWTGCWSCSPSASRCSRSPRRSTSAPRRAWTSASASSCCASR